MGIAMSVVDDNDTGIKIEKNVHDIIYLVCFIFIISLIISSCNYDDLSLKTTLKATYNPLMLNVQSLPEIGSMVPEKDGNV